MALADLNVSLGLVTRDFDKALRKTERSLNRFSRNLTSIGSTLTASVTVPIAAIGGSALKTAADFETLRTSFGVLLGDVDKGNRLFKELQDFSASTPFQLQDIAGAAKQLLAFSFSAEETKNALQFLGDIAAGTGSNLGDLALILGQSKAIGAAYTQDLRQLANRGIPVFDLLKERLNLSGEELNKFVSDGKVSFEILQDVLKSTTNAGGLFAGGLQAQSKTLSGLFSTLKDNISLALADIGDSISQAFNLNQAIPALVKQIQDAVAIFRNLDDETKKGIVRFAAFAAAIGPAVFALGKVTSTVSTLIGFGRSLTTFLVSNAGKFAIYTGAASTAEIATKRLNLALKLSFAGIALAAIGILVGKFLEYRNAIKASSEELDAAKTAAGAFADVEKQASAAIAERVAKVNVLVETAQDETKAESERVSAIKKLKAEYPDYFGNVSEDISKTGQLTTAKDSLTESLLREARARAAGQKIQELANKTLEIEEKIASKKAEQQEVINQLASKGLTIAQAVAKVEEFTAKREKLNSEARTASLFSQDQGIKNLVDRYKELGNESNALTSETFRLTDAQKKLAEVATQGADTITPRVTTQPQLLSQQQQTGTNVINKTTQIEETQFTFSKGLKDFADANKIARQEIEILGNKTKVALQPLEDFKSPLTGFLSEVNGQLDDIRTRFEAVNGSELEIVNAQVDALKAKLKDAAVAFGENSEAVQKLKERIAELEGVQALNIVVEKLKAGFDSLVTESLTAFFDALASGGNALKAFGDAAKQVLKKLIQDLLVAVTRALILATAFSIISGGGAGISLGSAFKFFLGGGKFAEGGIVPPGFPNDTYPALLTSGERVIPAGRPLPGDNGQLTGEIRLSGNDLVVALERFQNNRTRRRGI